MLLEGLVSWLVDGWIAGGWIGDVRQTIRRVKKEPGLKAMMGEEVDGSGRGRGEESEGREEAEEATQCNAKLRGLA
jgi:hypothetical protein